MKLFLSIAAGLLLFALGIWSIALPEEALVEKLERSVNGGGFTLEISGFRKGLLYTFQCRSVVLRRGETPVFSMENLRGAVHILSLFRLKLPISFEAESGGGKATGRAELLGARRQVHLALEGADMAAVPFFAVAGLKGRGALSGKLSLEAERGELTFSLQKARMEKGSFMGVSVPFEVFHTVRCALVLARNSLTVHSLVMEGKGIYARVKGSFAGAAPDAVLEIMPDASFEDSGGLLPFLTMYKVSPGYYVIPLRSGFFLQ
ncbi:MAG: type II secretion system protein GspN [Alphaproteobacteria bacterium]|uniref:Type II secretion system protein GspN n=1 Tax=Candidatus Nitrobium versatile TaxID=2884831 RepID=A0A953J1N8_9BACT|nr:type II secretion system protein GspN [Candidatus Nitrobium versatile]